MIKDSAKVAADIIKYGTKAEKTCISTLNKTATVLKKKAAENMAKQIFVPESRIAKQIIRMSRAKVGNMQTGIFTEHRGVQLRNFPHAKTRDGVRVKISPTGGFKTIKHAFIGKVPLKGSGITGYIGMRNSRLIKMLMSTPAMNQAERNSRLARLRKKKSWGISVLYGTSENQMLYDIKERGDLTPTLLTTMANDFQARFKK